MTRTYPIVVVALVVAVMSAVFGVAWAQEDETEVVVEDQEAAAQITDLNTEILQKRDDIGRLNRNIEEYRKKIEAAQAKSATLASETELLENRIAKSELDILATDAEMEAVGMEIEVLKKRMTAVESQLKRERESLSEILRKMDVYDNDMTLRLLFSSDSFGDLFDRLQELESVTTDLEDALQRAEAERVQLEADRAEQVGKRASLSQLQTQQENQKELLQGELGAKESLLAQTERSEAQFQTFLADLRGEQQYLNQEIVVLQGEIESKLNAIDTDGQGSSVLSWPVPPLKGLSTTFRDPTYPFRHLFEHSGIDVPTPQGTKVTSAAPGYVAWTRTGKLYGNYVMIIHTDGVATLYAHLSKVTVEQDQFVARGSTIALSGGAPGTSGAGLSTGPHLHFEVREDGIPVNPMNYLVSD